VAQGRVYHLGVKRGEVANRILSVGDTGRARLLSGEAECPHTLCGRFPSSGAIS
jgi:uridine phosphorylase